MFQKLVYCAADILFEISGFLSAVEYYRFSMTGTAVKYILDSSSDRFWDNYILYHMPCFYGYVETVVRYDEIQNMKSVLGYKSSKDFCKSFLGWFHVLLSEYDSEPALRLYYGRHINNILLYQEVYLRNGRLDTTCMDYIFKLDYNVVSGNFIATFPVEVDPDTHHVELGNAGKSMTFIESTIISSLHKIETSQQVSLSQSIIQHSNVSSPAVIVSCLGLNFDQDEENLVTQRIRLALGSPNCRNGRFREGAVARNSYSTRT